MGNSIGKGSDTDRQAMWSKWVFIQWDMEGKGKGEGEKREKQREREGGEATSSGEMERRVHILKDLFSSMEGKGSG